MGVEGDTIALPCLKEHSHDVERRTRRNKATHSGPCWTADWGHKAALEYAWQLESSHGADSALWAVSRICHIASPARIGRIKPLRHRAAGGPTSKRKTPWAGQTGGGDPASPRRSPLEALYYRPGLHARGNLPAPFPRGVTSWLLPSERLHTRSAHRWSGRGRAPWFRRRPEPAGAAVGSQESAGTPLVCRQQNQV